MALALPDDPWFYIIVLGVVSFFIYFYVSWQDEKKKRDERERRFAKLEQRVKRLEEEIEESLNK